ncbi:hypothetical protein FRUB_08125 [Fimbriiglobus ruber]|uniref:Uncharacterized protein n=1 Tax=Fimbriiglobus ruber TaxID=1908690 RepID=A0A225D215_9BACT|nr:hypothetical protein FRUB_08125 [Fimbriiglobus ruber]
MESQIEFLGALLLFRGQSECVYDRAQGPKGIFNLTKMLPLEY